MSDVPDGFTLREATPDDHDAIVALCRDVFGAHEGAAVQHLLTVPGYGPGRWTVVTDPAGEVVSCCTLFLHVMRYGCSELPAAQVEFVATRESVRKLGLVRAQFAVHHQWADEAGALVQFVTGIPYLYRRLGYGYGVDCLPELRLVDRPEAPDGWQVDAATVEDLDAIRVIDGHATDRADLALVNPDSGWNWLLVGAPAWEEEILVARHRGAVEGFACVQRRPEEKYAFVFASADNVDAALAMLVRAREIAGDLPLWVVDRPGDAWSVVAARYATRDPARFNGIYARIPDPVSLLTHLRPELSARLAASPFAGQSGELKLSFYETGLILRFDCGEVTDVQVDPEPALDPLDDDGAGVPPDAVPALLLGRFGALELEHRFDDVGYVDDRALMATLFPRMAADLSAPI